MDPSSKIYVAGHTGLVGSAVVRKLQDQGYSNLILRTRQELDLQNRESVRRHFATERPDTVIVCAAKVGGIKANMSHPAAFLYENLEIQNNTIWAAKEFGARRLLFLGSSCIYPRESPQPMKEEYFSTGRPEPTNEAYAYAKIAGMKLCEYIHDEFHLNFSSCMPTNIYGENDNFDPETSHVIPSLIRRMHEAKVEGLSEVVIWGTGLSRREFLHVDDLADAVVWLLSHYDDRQFLNIGTGEDISIKELAFMIRDLVDFKGDLLFDATKPDGMPRKLLDVSRLHTAGWRHKVTFEQGLRRTYEWYLAQVAR